MKIAKNALNQISWKLQKMIKLMRLQKTANEMNRQLLFLYFHVKPKSSHYLQLFAKIRFCPFQILNTNKNSKSVKNRKKTVY